MPQATEGDFHLPATLDFQGTALNIRYQHGQPWLAAADLARALGYRDADKVSQLYRRNIAEFTPDMSETLNLSASEKINNLQPIQTIRIFSSRSCHLIAMFARTPRAAAFRRWVLDVLEHYGESTPLPASEEPEYSPEQAVAELTRTVEGTGYKGNSTDLARRLIESMRPGWLAEAESAKAPPDSETACSPSTTAPTWLRCWRNIGLRSGRF